MYYLIANIAILILVNNFTHIISRIFTRFNAFHTKTLQDIMWEFQYGIQYAWVLCIISVVVAYSVSCPVIAPFGLYPYIIYIYVCSNIVI